MVKICVLQTDNRPSLEYLLLTQKVNKKMCNYLGYDYLFIEMNDNEYESLHPATRKIYIVNDFLYNYDYDILVFLDSDAWIQDARWLNDIINNLIKNGDKLGCFSRDPYIKKNTFINSGSFIIKINKFTKLIYKNVIDSLNSNYQHHTQWPFDQYYISNNIFPNKDLFYIFVPDVLNTPIGKVLRHNWLKNEKMYNDLNKLLEADEKTIINELSFEIEKFYDKKPYPNTIVRGYEYYS